MRAAAASPRRGCRMARVPDGRRADREQDVGRARHPPRQHLHPRRRAAYRDPDAGGAVRAARGRPAVAVADDRLLGAGKRGRRPAARDRSARMRAARSAPIPSSARAGSAPISSSAAPSARWWTAASTILSPVSARRGARLRPRSYCQRIGGLPALRNDEHERVRRNDRLAIAKLGGDVALDRNFGEAFVCSTSPTRPA